MGSKQHQPPAKKVHEDPNMAGVREAINKANLSDRTKLMLQVCLLNSLGVPSAERHETQATVINMIKTAIDGVTQQLQDAVEKEKAKITDAECQKEQLEASLSKVQATLSQAEEAVQAKDAALADAATDQTAAKDALFERKEAQREHDGALLQAQEQEAAIHKVLAEDFQAIVDGTSASYQGPLELLQDISLDASLLSALPKTCGKAVIERGQFDTMVLDQLKSLLVGKAAQMAKTIKEAAPAAAQRIAAIEAAQSDLDNATAKSRKAAEELADAKKVEAQAKAAVQEAQQALDKYQPEFAEATKECDQAVSNLQNWVDYNVACFEVLAA